MNKLKKRKFPYFTKITRKKHPRCSNLLCGHISRSYKYVNCSSQCRPNAGLPGDIQRTVVWRSTTMYASLTPLQGAPSNFSSYRLRKRRTRRKKNDDNEKRVEPPATEPLEDARSIKHVVLIIQSDRGPNAQKNPLLYVFVCENPAIKSPNLQAYNFLALRDFFRFISASTQTDRATQLFFACSFLLTSSNTFYGRLFNAFK